MGEAFAQSAIELPTAWRVGVKLRTGARALLDAALRRGVGLAPEEEAALLSRLEAVAAQVGGTGPDAMDRIGAAWGLSAADQVLFVATGLPELDPLAAELARRLHPQGMARLPISVAAEFYPGGAGPMRLQRLSCGHPLLESELLRLEGDGPLVECELRFGPGVWSGIFGEPLWPERCKVLQLEATLAGLSDWAQEAEPAAAIVALQQGGPVAIICSAEQRNVRLGRSAALCGFAERRFAVLELRSGESDRVPPFLAHALLRGCCPVLALEADPAGDQSSLIVPGSAYYPAPVVIAIAPGQHLSVEARPSVVPQLTPIAPDARAAAWQVLVPELAPEDAKRLAARFSIEPLTAAALAVDARRRARAAGRSCALSDVTAAIRARGALIGGAGSELRRATAGWDDIALGDEAMAALKAAVARLEASATVLPAFDAAHRPSGGLKLLFTGPPGTGKTLAAEVLASEIGADLLVVDSAKVLSKWLGESERNLAAAFDAAAESHAILFFDEADALFSRRTTDAADAHSRYANLQTAFLLQRLERFGGIAILATNLPRSLDDAFRRRFDAVIEFNDPAAGERVAIWRQHLPQAARAAGTLDLDGLAAWYAMPGAWIRNAAHAAAFTAAAEGAALHQTHLLEAVMREYRKAGRAFPGTPPGAAPASMEVKNAV
jgi:hypothetical protein